LNDSDRRTRADRQALLVLFVRGGTPRPLSLSIFKYKPLNIKLHDLSSNHCQNNYAKMRNRIQTQDEFNNVYARKIELTVLNVKP